MDSRWENKVAVVTGASAGIGAKIAIQLADAGMVVVGLARRPELIKALQENVSGSGQIHSRKCDVTDETEVLDAFKWIADSFGEIHVFVNNAGIIKAAFMLDSSTEDFKELFNVNVVASCLSVREALKVMRAHGTNGHIVIINSILGHRVPDVPVPLFSVYPSTKHAISALCQTVRQEIHFHKLNIKLTSISPGMVDTDFLGVYDSSVCGQLPKLKPEDVAGAVMYALNTPGYVQIEDIILQAMFRHE